MLHKFILSILNNKILRGAKNNKMYDKFLILVSGLIIAAIIIGCYKLIDWLINKK